MEKLARSHDISKPKRSRRQYTPEPKTAVLRRHLVDGVQVSEVCNEVGVKPSLFYQWQRQAMENLSGALAAPVSAGHGRREKELAAKVEHLEARIVTKDSVIAEISAEYVQLKNSSGEP